MCLLLSSVVLGGSLGSCSCCTGGFKCFGSLVRPLSSVLVGRRVPGWLSRELPWWSCWLRLVPGGGDMASTCAGVVLWPWRFSGELLLVCRQHPALVGESSASVKRASGPVGRECRSCRAGRG